MLGLGLGLEGSDLVTGRWRVGGDDPAQQHLLEGVSILNPKLY